MTEPVVASALGRKKKQATQHWNVENI